MPVILTLLAFLAILALAWVILKSGRGAKTGDAKPPVPERTPEREQKEAEILARLERLKSKKDRAAKAIEDDPVRAAKVVRTMMREKPKQEP
ncbi:MAG: hypothetical protein LBU79_00040 [Planctomycetota bacterium]|nr:hypothetical protein [Planctomycetota bacterium]